MENNCKKFSTSTAAKNAASSECAYLPSQISMNPAVIIEKNALPRILYASSSRLLNGPGKRKSTSAAEKVTAGSPTDVSITIRQYASSAPVPYSRSVSGSTRCAGCVTADATSSDS